MSKITKLIYYIFFFLLDFANASEPINITTEEIALLPKYCPYTQGSKPGITVGAKNHPQSEAWLNTIGPGFWHLHHYCWALVQIRRADKSTTPDQLRNGYRQSAIGNMEYVIRNSPGDLVLLPEIYTWIGRLELRQKRPERAQQYFEKAKSLKIDYWPAYYHWAEHLFSMNNNKEALKITLDGLVQSPSSKPLLELRSKLEMKAR